MSIVSKSKGIGGHTNANRGVTDSWITPKEIVSALGEFDLDPCQCTPQPWSCAKGHYAFRDDGLSRQWFGRVWLNPPYSSVWDWMKRLADHGQGTALIFARTETAGFVEQVWNRASAIMFLHGRLHFHYPDGTRAKGNSGGPSCLVAYGDQDAKRLKESRLVGSIVTNWKDCEMSNEIKVGDWTIAEAELDRLIRIRAAAGILREDMEELAAECCVNLGIDPTTDSVARDICEEIVLHGTPVEEVVAKLQRHLEGGR